MILKVDVEGLKKYMIEDKQFSEERILKAIERLQKCKVWSPYLLDAEGTHPKPSPIVLPCVCASVVLYSRAFSASTSWPQLPNTHGSLALPQGKNTQNRLESFFGPVTIKHAERKVDPKAAKGKGKGKMSAGGPAAKKMKK